MTFVSLVYYSNTSGELSMSISSSISNKQRAAIAYHGLHLVPDVSKEADSGVARSNFFYRVAAVGAALFLAMTVC